MIPAVRIGGQARGGAGVASRTRFADPAGLVVFWLVPAGGRVQQRSMAQTAFILLVTEDEDAGNRLREALRSRSGHLASVVGSVTAALESIRTRAPDVVVTRATVGGEPAGEPLAGLLDGVARDAALLIVGEPPAGWSARIPVAHLPASAPLEEKLRTIDELARKAISRRESRLLQETLAGQDAAPFEGLIGAARSMRTIFGRIEKVAPSKLTVLILGETGTGKELVAEAIHRRSDRKNKPFIALNCAAFPETLLESQLFGHVRGAFTDAVRDHKGFFVAADGGTLFLDEIGEMPLHMQVKLLRVLDRREVTPIGSTEVRRVDVRLVAATNVDLYQRVEVQQFRQDLLYRLNQAEIRVPPLRERREDIPLLAEHFRRAANAEHGTDCEGIASDALAALTKHYWPGNIRELRSLVETLVVEVRDRPIELDDLPERIRGSRDIVPVQATGMVGLTMAQVERMMIERTLQATNGNREQAAKMLDIGTRTLYRKIREYGL